MTDEDGLRDVVSAAAAGRAYALDTEFHRERTYFARLALLQLAWDDGLVLVDPLAVDIAPLCALLDSDAVCVMHAAAQDLEILQRHCGTVPRRFFDTQVAAGFVGYSSPGLAPLLQGRLGVRVPKADRLSDWMARPLPEPAARYAASDVAHLLALYDDLVAELEGRGRADWAAAECDRVLARAVAQPDPNQAWWRIKEARNLKGRAAAVAQSLAAWREQRAAEVDRPVRFVLPDLAVVAMAQRPPRTVEDLRRVRGLDDRQLRGDAGGRLLAAVAEGLSLDDADVVTPSAEGVDRSARATVALVSAWVSQRARDLEIDPAILATRADVEALLAGRPTRLSEGWRHEAVGEPVRLLVAGKASLAVDDQGRLVIEARSGEPLE